MHPIIELRLLQYAVTLAEELSFTRAARKLYIAQPALSRQIKELEGLLGVQLFDRSTRLVTLTPGGMAFIEEARAALTHSERAIGLARAVARGESSPLSIGFSPHYNFELLGLIKKRAVTYFGEGIVFTSSFTREQAQRVSDGSWDAGLCFFPVDDPALETLVLLEEPVSVVVHKNNRLAGKQDGKVRHHEMQNEAVILFSRRINPGFSRELENFWAGVSYKPKTAQDVSTIAEALALVSAGVGIAFIKSSLRNMLPPTVKMLDFPDEERLTVKMGVLYRKIGRSAGAEKFLKLISGLAQSKCVRSYKRSA